MKSFSRSDNSNGNYLDDSADVVDNEDRHFDVFARRFPASFEITSLNHQVELVPAIQSYIIKKKKFPSVSFNFFVGGENKLR